MTRKLVLASAVSLALLPGVATALGLGGIRAQSALNEPFFAEIDLVDAKPDELDAIKVLLAPPEEFERAGSPRPHFLTRLRFQPQVSPQGRPVILVTSSDPVREPFLDFLVELNWPQGRMVKGYTVLLDPPVTLDRRAPRVERAAVASVTAPTRAAADRPSTGGVAAVPAGVSSGAFPLRYGPVESGAGLWRVARNLAPPGATVAQTAMALYRSNQRAFIRGDINKLRVGQVLEIPSAAELFALSAADAEREFRAALRGGRVTTSPLVQVADAAPAEDHLRIATVPDTPAAPVPPTVAPPAAAPAPELGALQQELLLVQEAGESTRQETAELRARIRELEGQLLDIQRLLQLRNEQLAMVQATQREAPLAPVAEATEIAPLVDEAEPAVESAAPPDVAELPAAAPEVEPVVAEPGPETVAETPVPPAVDLPTPDEAPAPEPEVAAVDEAPPPAPEAPRIAAVEPAPPPVAEPVAAVPGERPPTEARREPAAPETWLGAGWVEALVASPMAVGGSLAVLAALLTLIVVRRRRHLGEMLPQEALVAGEGGRGASAMPPEGGLLTGAAAAKPSWADSRYVAGDSTLAAPEGEAEEADVVSEADVYIAYGRYREAQSLLETELRRAPNRVDLKLKLAEAYAGSKNLAALKELMGDLERSGVHRLHPSQWDRLEKALGGLQAAEPTPPAPAPRGPVAAPPTPAAPREESRLALGAVGAAAASVAPAAPGPSRAADLDLDLDGLDLFGAGPAAKGEAPATTTDLDLQRQELDRFSEIAFGDSEMVEPAPLRPSPVATQQPASTSPLSDSFDLLMPLSKETGLSQPTSSEWQADSGLWDEVTTKIDLARAYIEMEDPEAARVILQEVVSEGSASQQAEARDMLARLG